MSTTDGVTMPRRLSAAGVSPGEEALPSVAGPVPG
jgi:hypothetical protein